MEIKVLIVEDDAALATTFQRFLRGAGYLAEVAGDYPTGLARLATGSYHLAFLDINLPGRQTGLDLLRTLRESNLPTLVVIVTGYPEVTTAAAAVRHAAFDYLCKPIEKEELLRIAAAASRQIKERQEQEQYLHNLESAFRSVAATVATAECQRQPTPHPPPGLHSPSPDPRQEALSRREKQILALLGQGETNAEIAAACTIGLRTVETYFARISAKLALPGMKALRRYAIKHNSL